MWMTNKTKQYRKCKSCNLDCVIVRARAVEKIVDCKKKEVLESMFGEGNPKYSMQNCPKR